MKSILFLIGTLGGGGAERVLIDLVNNIDSTKYDVTVQTVIDEGIYIHKLNSNIKYKSIIKSKNYILKGIIIKILLKHIPANIMYKLFVEDSFDYEVAFLEGIPTKIIACSKQKSKKIAWVHTNFEKNFDSLRYFRNLTAYRNCYKRYDEIICVSNDVKKGFTSTIGQDIVPLVKYNVLDEKEILNKSLLESHNLGDHIRIISVGRLQKEKGYDRLINISKKLREKGLTFSVTILGEGKERDTLEKMIVDNDLSQYVSLIGFKNNPYSYIAQSDIFVCSSREEGYSTVVTEALILGIPVITTDCAGMEELFGSNRCGLIVKNDTEALYEALLNVIENPNILKYYKKEAILRGKDFKKEDRLRDLMEIFKEIPND